MPAVILKIIAKHTIHENQKFPISIKRGIGF